jgi:hypothetical protein
VLNRDKAIVFALMLLLITAAAGFFGFMPGFKFARTKYAPGFSEAAFYRVRLGDSEAKLLALLGPPMRRSTLSTGEVRLDYSMEGWTYSYHRYMIILSNDAVRTSVNFWDHR